MEPNQNVPGVGSTRPVAGPAPRPATQRAVQPTAQPAPAEAGPVFKDEPKKKSHATLLGMILLAILAISGIGFGVWAYLDGNARVAKLNETITGLNGTIAEMQTVNEEETTVDENGVATTTEIGDYIYVGEWGIKIKKPENWRDTIESYSYSNDYPHAVDSFFIKQLSEADFASVAISYVGTCEGKVMEESEVCMEIGGEGYTILPGVGLTEDFAEYFTNVENYSAI